MAKARWAAVRQLREYQVFKHTEIFDVVVRSGNAIQAAQARQLAARCIATGEAFQAHVTRWGSQDVVAQWALYQPAVTAMIARLRRSLASEQVAIAALLAGSQSTRALRA